MAYYTVNDCNISSLSFSLRFFAKELFYRITTKPSIPNEHYEDQIITDNNDNNNNND